MPYSHIHANDVSYHIAVSVQLTGGACCDKMAASANRLPCRALQMDGRPTSKFVPRDTHKIAYVPFSVMNKIAMKDILHNFCTGSGIENYPELPFYRRRENTTQKAATF